MNFLSLKTGYDMCMYILKGNEKDQSFLVIVSKR